MAASLPSDVHPTHPESSRSDELLPTTKTHTADADKQPSEEADVGSHHPAGHTQSPRGPIAESQQVCSLSLPFSSERERRGHESATATATSIVVGREAVVHPETSSVEEEDVCEGCGRSRVEGKRLLKLEREVRRLKETLKEREETITRLWEENARKTAELLEFQLQKVCQYVWHVGFCWILLLRGDMSGAEFLGTYAKRRGR